MDKDNTSIPRVNIENAGEPATAGLSEEEDDWLESDLIVFQKVSILILESTGITVQ